jgi:adenine-specific DNA-methyltransferase
MTKNKLAQYFTINQELKQKLLDFILNNPSNILEPSIGQGDLVKFIIDTNKNIIFDMYEIDKTITLLENIDRDKVIYGDFMIQNNFAKKYKTIIGNPPYIRTKSGNLYIDFTEKCYNLLEENGELIFIVPSDFLKLTSSSKLLNTMMNNGTFTHIFHPHNEKMFENATIDIIVFRYCKNKELEKRILYNDKIMYITNSDGLITFNEKKHTEKDFLFSDYFDIYVGLVSGKEEIFKHTTFGNIKLLNGEDRFENYIYIEKYPCDDEDINKYLLENKKILIERKIKQFTEKNWFEWGAPRNIKAIKLNINKKCIYIYNITRKNKVAFVSTVDYFGGSLLMLIPKKECELDKILSYLNSKVFKDNFIFSGRFKIGHRQISKCYIPSEYL